MNVRSIFVSTVALMISQAATASQYTGPLVATIEGRVANSDGVVRKCEVTPKKDVGDVAKLIEEASKASVEVLGLHFRAQVPSKEVVAYQVVPKVGGPIASFEVKEVLLYRDHSRITGRRGAAADALIKVAEESCK